MSRVLPWVLMSMAAGCFGTSTAPLIRQPGRDSGEDIRFDEEFRHCLLVEPESTLTFDDSNLSRPLAVTSDCPDLPVKLVLDDPASAFTVDPSTSQSLEPGTPMNATVTLVKRDGERHEAQLIVRILVDGKEEDATLLQLSGLATP